MTKQLDTNEHESWNGQARTVLILTTCLILTVGTIALGQCSGLNGSGIMDKVKENESPAGTPSAAGMDQLNNPEPSVPEMATTSGSVRPLGQSFEAVDQHVADPLPFWIIQDLAKSGITSERAIELGFRPVTADEYMDLLGLEGRGLSDGFAIPFFDPSTGQPLTTPTGAPFVRVKLRTVGQTTDPLTGKPASVKYLSPRDGGQHAYILPEVHAQFMKDGQTIILSEGEKKVAGAQTFGLSAIGLTGSWGWKRHNGGLLPELRVYAKKGGTWIVIWDSDASNNPDFADSTRSLAAELDPHGCILKQCVLPKLGSTKTGLDDYLLDPAGGPDRLVAWINENSRVIRPVQRFASGNAEEWTTPQPLSHAAEDLPAFPWDALPPKLSAMGQSVAQTMDVADELVGLDILCTTSIAIGNKFEVAIKPDHIQFGNLFGMAVVPPAGGKTPVGQAIHWPLNQYEREQRKIWETQLASWKTKAAVAEGRIAQLEREAAREPDGQTRAELMKVITDERTRMGEAPPEPRVYVSDATSEAVAKRMSANGGAIGVLTSEGRKVLSIARGRYAKDGADIDMWLAGHSGRDPIRIDRASTDKPTIVIPQPCLSAFIAVQPDVLQPLAENPELSNSGWLGRWLFVIPSHCHSHYPRTSVPRDIADAYDGVIHRLLMMPRHKDASGAFVPQMVPMTEAARSIWIEIHDQLQQDLQVARKDRRCEAYLHWLGKAAEHVARIALLFRVVRHIADGVPLDVVDEQDVYAAAVVMACLQGHARRVFGIMSEPAAASRARALWPILDGNRAKLLEWRQADLGRDLVAAKPRDIVRYGWAGISDTKQAEQVLEFLAVKGWVRRREFPTKSTNWRAHDHIVYELHPNPSNGGGVS